MDLQKRFPLPLDLTHPLFLQLPSVDVEVLVDTVVLDVYQMGRLEGKHVKRSERVRCSFTEVRHVPRLLSSTTLRPVWGGGPDYRDDDPYRRRLSRDGSEMGPSRGSTSFDEVGFGKKEDALRV